MTTLGIVLIAIGVVLILALAAIAFQLDIVQVFGIILFLGAMTSIILGFQILSV